MSNNGFYSEILSLFFFLFWFGRSLKFLKLPQFFQILDTS